MRDPASDGELRGLKWYIKFLYASRRIIGSSEFMSSARSENLTKKAVPVLSINGRMLQAHLMKSDNNLSYR